MATTLYVGTGGYASINAAIDAAAKMGGAVTIEIAAGIYAENITLDARSRTQTGDLVFKAAPGAKVTLTGLVTLGYREQGTGAAMWNANVAFEGITFDQAADEKHSINVQDVKSLTLTNCTIVGDGEYGIGSASGNATGPSLIQNCTFTNASIQGLGNFCTGLVIDKCTFNDSRINIQAGNLVTVQNSTFNCSLTAANVNDSFYCIRSNDDAINVTGCTFNIDSKLAEVAENQAKWAIIWQRGAGGSKWEVSNITVNLTETAMAQTELLLNKNVTATAANEAGRVTITGLTSSSNDVAALLGRSEGIVNVVSGGKWMIYDDGALKSTKSAETLYVSSAYTASNVPAGTLFGFDAFSSFTEAIQSATADTTTIKLDSDIKEIMPDDVEIMASGNLLITADKKVKLEFSNKGTACDFVLDAVAGKSGSKIIFGANIDFAITDRLIWAGYYNNGVSVDIYGNVAGYQWWNGADTTVYAGGTLSTTGEAMVFRRNKTLTVVGNAAQGAAKEDRVWQVNANYYQILSGKVVATDAYLKGGSIWIGGDARYYGEGQSQLNISNTVWESSGNMTLDNGVFNVTNGSSLVVGLQDGYAISNVSATGQLNITDSSFNSPGITNNGTITVSGTSTLNINSFTGNAIVAKNATLVNSVIKGGTDYISVEQNGYKFVLEADGVVNFQGENTIQNIKAGAGDTVNVTGTLHFVSGSDGFKLGDGATWNITNATIDGAYYLSLDGAVDSTAKSTMIVQNSTMNIGQISAKGTKEGQEIGRGTFDIDFIKSTVNLTGRFDIQPQETAVVDIAFTDSTVTAAKGRFRNGSANGVVTFDNTTATFAEDFGNFGTVYVVNGAVLTAGYRDFALTDSEKPNGNAGTINVNGATLDLNAASAGIAFDNQGTINISGTSTVNIDLIKGNAINASGTLVDSVISYDEFNGVTGNILANGNLEVKNGTFSKVQFRAGANDTITLSGDITATALTQFKAVETGAIIVNGKFSSAEKESSSIELEGAGAKLTVNEDASLLLTGAFYLNGGTTTINGKLAEKANLAALKKEDAQVNVAYSTWGSGDNAAKVVLNDTYVWNAMISVNNADTVVTLNNSRLTGWMSFDINGGKVVANGSYIDHQSAEGWTKSSIGTAGALVLTNGSKYIDDKAVLTNNGTITISADSFMSAKTLTGTGTITIDAEGFAFAAGETCVKVIDLTQNSALANVQLVNGAGFGLAYAADGDVYLAAAATTIHVNAAWAESTAGAFVGSDYIYGYNAFSNLTDALANVTQDTVISIESDITGAWFNDTAMAGTAAFPAYAISFQNANAEGTVTVTVGVNPEAMFSALITADMTIGKDVILDLNREPLNYGNFLRFAPAGEELTLTIDGTLIFASGDFGDKNDASKIVNVVVNKTGKLLCRGESNNAFMANSVLTVTGTGTADAKMAEVQLRTGTFATFEGAVSFTNTNVELTGMSIYILQDPKDRPGLPGDTFSGEAEFTATNTVITVKDFTVNPNVISFNKTSTLSNTDVYAGDFIVSGKSVTMTDGSTLNLVQGSEPADSTLGPTFDYYTAGKLEVKEGAVFALEGSDVNAVTIVNEGTITIDVTSTLTVNSITGSGSINITIDSADLVGDSPFVLINSEAVLSTANITVAIDNGAAVALNTLFGTEGDTIFVVKQTEETSYTLVFEQKDNDLIVRNLSNVIYVNSAYAEGNYTVGQEITEGIFFGVNAFASLDTISGKITEAPCKVIYNYAADAAVNGGIEVIVSNDGTSLVSYSVNGEYHNFYSNRTHEIAFKSTGTQTVEFVFTSGDFSFESSLVASNGAAEVVTPDTNGTLVSDKKVAVDEIAGDKSYIFEVKKDLGDFDCTVSGITGTGEIAIYALNSDGTRGELVAGRLFNRDTTFGVDELAKGKYEVVFSGYGYNAEAEFTANMTIDEYAVSPNHADDTFEGANKVAFRGTLSGDLGNCTADDRGEVDTVDWIKFTGLTVGERISIDFTVTGAPVSVSLYDAGQNLIANFYVYDDKTSGIDYSRYVTPGTESLFARVSSTGVAEYAVTTTSFVA